MLLRTCTLASAGIVVFGLTLVARQGTPPAAPTLPVPVAPSAPFYTHVVATGIKGGYQVVAADMNNDGKIDLIGLGNQETDLTWYENPYWTPHVIVRGMTRMINVAAADTNKDGIPELALAHGFNANPAQGGSGNISILTSTGDPKALWTIKEIDAIPSSHRVRFAVIGGETWLINAPIVNAKTRDGFNDPDHLPVPLRAYRAPAWKPETIAEANLGVVHGLFVGDWDGDGRPDVLTAGYSGVFAHSLGRGGTWTRTELAKGDPAAWPRGGASEIAVGTVRGKHFFVTDEPFHGNQVVVYQQAPDGTWPRNVIDTEINNAHSLALVDVDGDGTSEIVSGGTRGAAGAARGTKPGVFFYRAADPAVQKWERMVLDPNIASNSCVVADINGDRRPDVACIDDSLKWYENTR